MKLKKRGDKTKVYFRADGNSKIGLGHVIRSLALADMLKNHFDCHFIIKNPLPNIKQQVAETCKSIIEIQPFSDYEEEAQEISKTILNGDEIVVLDGYHFNTAYQRTIKNKGCKLVCIDDIHAYHFVADIVINHAGGLKKSDYSTEPYTMIFLGLKYALLRRPFREFAKNRTSLSEETNTFICLGGADPNNNTLEVLKLCCDKAGTGKYFLVIGEAFLYKDSIEEYLNHFQMDIEVLSNLSALEMISYMKKCKRAITSPSTIAYEYLSVGGELYLKTIAENQININNYFLSSGFAFSIQDYPLKNKEATSKALYKQKQAFDGKTDLRYINMFHGLNKP